MKRPLLTSLAPVAGAVLLAIQLAMGSTPGSALAGSSPRTKSTVPNPFGGADDNLRTPAEFESAAAASPNANGKVFVSRCRFAPFTSTNLYGSLGGTSNADTIQGDTAFSFADGTSCFNPQNETNIAINPTNSRNLVTSSNDYRYSGPAAYYSFDAGRTWNDVQLPGWTFDTGGQGTFKKIQTVSDPVLAFGPNGTVYMTQVVFTFPTGAPTGPVKSQTASGVAVAWSTNGGISWSAPHMLYFSDANNFFEDKPWITAGPNGALYLTWTRFSGSHAAGTTAANIVSSVSHDGGNSWSSFVQVNDAAQPNDSGSFPLVAPNGTLYVAYEGGAITAGTTSPDYIVVARSTNGGASFTNVNAARAYDDYNCYPINVAQGRPRLSGEQFRLNSFPSFAIDPTTGKLAIVWADDQLNSGCGFENGGTFTGSTNNQVKLITSTNGVTWSAPTFVTSGPADTAYPAVAANGGRLTITYYTRAYSPNTPTCQAQVQDTTTGALSLIPGAVCLDYAMKTSADSFASETRLSTESSNPYDLFAGAFIGDYTAVAMDRSGNTYPVWTDFRGNPGVTSPNQDILVAHVP